MFERIYSQIYKSIKSIKRNTFRIFDLTIWPLLYLFPLTFFADYIGAGEEFINLIILGMMGWRVVYFISHEMVLLFVEEYWSKSLAHFFISPISRLEYAIGASISGFAKASFVILLYLVLTNILYGFEIVDWGIFITSIIVLGITSLTIGLILLGAAYYIKEKEDAFSVAFIVPDAIVLLSGVYFSIDSVYPEYMIPYINLLPTTHAFNLLKSMLGFAEVDYFMLAATTAVWFVIAYFFNTLLYNAARREGKLAKLG